jgi:[protein-PII] uridylyltransferase
MQFDLFHVHTVDIHTMQVIRQIRDLQLKKSESSCPKACELIQTIDKPYILYLAALFHDIGKGRGVDHSTWGAQYAENFCAQHRIPENDTKLICFLIRYHLTLSLTAQKTDLSNPEIIRKFAHKLKDKKHLDYLYLLTISDIRGTNMRLWNGWKASLLDELYRKTVNYWSSTHSEMSIKDCKNHKHIALEIILSNLSTPKSVQKNKTFIKNLWKNWPPEYFQHFHGQTLAWHSSVILNDQPQNSFEKNPLNLKRIQTRFNPKHNQAELFIYQKSQPRQFAQICIAVDQLNLNIADARFYRTKEQYFLGHFILLDDQLKSLNSVDQLTDIQKQLHSILNSKHPLTLHQRRSKNSSQAFDINTEVLFLPQTVPDIHPIEIHTKDQPGLLAKVTSVLAELDLAIQQAKIATMGERAEDVFFVTPTNPNKPFNQDAIQQAIGKKLQHV